MSFATDTNTTNHKSEKKMHKFIYKDTKECGWWYEEIHETLLKYGKCVVELAGYKFEHYSCLDDFLDHMYKIPRVKKWMVYVESILIYGRIYGQLKYIKSELNKTRRIRARKYNRLIKTSVDETNVCNLMWDKLSNEQGHKDVCRFIQEDFLGVGTVGCVHCTKDKKSIDTILSHTTQQCKFQKKELICTICSTETYVCFDHPTSSCPNICKICKGDYGECFCHDGDEDSSDTYSMFGDQSEHDDICDDCGSRYCHCYY